MAVVVIGNNPRHVKQATCPHCSALLQYVNADIRERPESCMGDIDIKHYIECPRCNHEVRITY